MRILVFGPQGSGKGTQAELISRKYQLPYIATGDIFRFHLKTGTDLGQKVKSYTDAGELVPDSLTNELVRDRILQPDCAIGFVMDGYPRNKNQLEFLETITKIDHVFVINLTDEQAVDRLKDRLACKCGLSYHKKYNPPKKAGICDKCGDELFVRDDDKPKAIKKRLAIYHQETEPLLKVYKKKGILHEINGDQTIEEVFSEIDKIIATRDN